MKVIAGWTGSAFGVSSWRETCSPRTLCSLRADSQPGAGGHEEWPLGQNPSWGQSKAEPTDEGRGTPRPHQVRTRLGEACDAHQELPSRISLGRPPTN